MAETQQKLELASWFVCLSNDLAVSILTPHVQVVVLCFAVLLGGWVPQKHSYWTSISTDYATTSGEGVHVLAL